MLKSIKYKLELQSEPFLVSEYTASCEGNIAVLTHMMTGDKLGIRFQNPPILLNFAQLDIDETDFLDEFLMKTNKG